MTIAQPSVYWKRLWEPRTVPGWLVLGWKLVNAFSNIDYLKTHMSGVWDFLTTPLGNVLLILGGLGWIAAVVFLPRKKAEPVYIPPPSPDSGTSLPWYAQMVTDDQTRMRQKLMAVKWEPDRGSFKGSDPYIDFNVTFVNASIFDLNKPETIRGKVRFRNQPLASPPQLEKQFVFAMPRGNHSWLKIRQHVTPGMAAEMKTAINLDAATILDFSEVSIPFTGRCDGVANTTFEWVGPHSVSFKDTTPFATA